MPIAPKYAGNIKYNIIDEIIKWAKFNIMDAKKMLGNTKLYRPEYTDSMFLKILQTELDNPYKLRDFVLRLAQKYTGGK